MMSKVGSPKYINRSVAYFRHSVNTRLIIGIHHIPVIRTFRRCEFVLVSTVPILKRAIIIIVLLVTCTLFGNDRFYFIYLVAVKALFSFGLP